MNLSTRLESFWEKFGTIILVILAIALTAIVAFRAGQTSDSAQSAAKINISLAQEGPTNPKKKEEKVFSTTLERKGLTSEGSKEGSNETELASVEDQNCVLVGSKNSTKYHLPNCKNATRINVSNRVCFGSVRDAENKGYEKAKCCHK